jgi:hypothetical protein
MQFVVVGQITDIEIIAVGSRIQILPFFRRKFGKGRWRKSKGKSYVKLQNGNVRFAEVHWFEAHGIGKRLMRIKNFLD